MTNTTWVLVGSIGLLACGGAATSTQADFVDQPKLQELAEVPRPISTAKAKAPKEAPPERRPVTEAVPIEGSELVRGRSTVVVEAPRDKVRKTVLRYGQYAQFMPHYRASKILRKTEAGHEVYMQVAALHGAVKMWARLEMTPRKDGNAEFIESRFIDGNVKDFRAIWRLEPVEGGRTKLSLEVFLHPSLPLPKGVLNGENVKGAEKGVLAMRDRIEKGG